MRDTKAHRATQFSCKTVPCHIRVHIRAQQEGIVPFTARCSARSPHIRPQRKFACNRSFQISFISVPSFPVKFFPTHLQTGASICSVPGSKTFAFFFPLGLWICCLHYIPSYPVCQWVNSSFLQIKFSARCAARICSIPLCSSNRSNPSASSKIFIFPLIKP